MQAEEKPRWVGVPVAASAVTRPGGTEASSSDRRTPVANADDIENAGQRPALLAEDEAPNWPDETAEAAFLSDAKTRGEVVRPVPKAAEEGGEESEPSGPLPALDELVQRIPAEVRETLDDLFRAKFVKVQRVPAKALKK